MKNVNLALSILLILVGAGAAFYCGVGSLFILGDSNPQYRPMGYIFVGIAIFGLALSALGIMMAARFSTRR